MEWGGGRGWGWGRTLVLLVFFVLVDLGFLFCHFANAREVSVTVNVRKESNDSEIKTMWGTLIHQRGVSGYYGYYGGYAIFSFNKF